jgi:RNA polymerase sigma-70 factor (ECF subfamily)
MTTNSRRHPEVRSDVHDLPAMNPEAWRFLDANHILGALSQMDEVYRDVLEAFYLRELSYREIAEKFKIPVGTVMSRLSRGKEQLRTILFKGES